MNSHAEDQSLLPRMEAKIISKQIYCNYKLTIAFFIEYGQKMNKKCK